MQIIILDENITLSRGSSLSAGFDVQSCSKDDITLYPGEQVKIPLGFKVFAGSVIDEQQENDGTLLAALLLPRSGLGTNHGLVLGNTVGLIDADYQGQLIAAVKNTGKDPYTIKYLERIGQLVFVPVFVPEFEVVSHFSVETERGTGGFGSTGV